ncbi:MAG: hypothetical protein JO240_06455, partial [Solirubrobacterales bacterium]|nr:hypothetical protein [Solirubrobacterales bacterium]
MPPDSRLFAIVYLPSARFVIGSGAPVQATELPFVNESYPETDVHDQPGERLAGRQFLDQVQRSEDR